MGNYLFYHKFIIKALNEAPNACPGNVKSYEKFQKSLVSMTKNEVDKKKVESFVFMAESVETSLSL